MNKSRRPFFGPELVQMTKIEANCLGGTPQLTVAE
jgi:hypothetical protein